MSDKPLILSIVEHGGYPDFTPLYESLGFRVAVLNSVRKAQAFLKKNAPSVVVAEFNFDPDFRDRLSTLESLMATLQCRQLDSKVCVFVEKEHQSRLDMVKQRYHFDYECIFPIDEEVFEQVITEISKTCC